ncbi:roadblock/LC7 domain-containing protein [Undibacterium sp. RuTC16W]|uniref:roadblock/LC7 domain-containing protein n=1 Tax=Undibacterium sp. RuTC16W TaxID=3413048 RepID=UPI003BF2450B
MMIKQELRDRAKIAADFIHFQAKGIKAVVISTEDGFEVAARVENTAQITRLSAMASSFAALGALAGEESNLGQCDDVIVEAREGVILILQIPGETATLIMSVVAGRDAVVGQVLYFAKQAARTLQRV